MKKGYRSLAIILSVCLLSGMGLPVAAEESTSQEGAAGEAAVENTADPSAASGENTAQPPAAEEGNSSVPAAEGDASAVKILSFAGLDGDTAVKKVGQKPGLEELLAGFPQTLSVTVEGSDQPADLPVTWTCMEDYEGTQYNTYEFTPSWDQAAYVIPDGVSAEPPRITVKISPKVTATSYIVKMDEAKAELDKLSAGKAILALVYLCDSYQVRSGPGADSGEVCTVTSGQSVQIKGVEEDSGKNLWFKVSFSKGGSDYEGYIERGNLAYSDQDFLSWEKKYVITIAFRSMDVGEGYKDVLMFDPSYQDALNQLKKAHPQWIFVEMDTGLNWSDVVSNQMGEKSLIWGKSNDAWKDHNDDGTVKKYDNNWAYASEGILKYYLDPRNFLTESSIFQFELLSYNSTYHTQPAVQNILNGTFMEGSLGDGDSRSYAEVFCTLGSSHDVSPFHLASRVRQEQGNSGSAMISGTYPNYEGYYNYFNIGATGQGETAIVKGLERARSEGWNNRYASLDGGAVAISQGYIAKGQNTLYLQKFNVDGTHGHPVYTHQYMQNIEAPAKEAPSIKGGYEGSGALNNPFVFRIPVYNGMPSTSCEKPSAVDKITLDTSTIDNLTVESTATVIPYVNGTAVSALSVSFSSDKDSVATVNGEGVITAVSPGTATITCKRAGALSATCKVSVIKASPSYTLPALPSMTYDPDRTLAQISLPEGWAWLSPSIVPVVGNKGYTAVYTPSDTSKYNSVTTAVPVPLEKAIPSYTFPSNLWGESGSTLSTVKLPVGYSWESDSKTVLSGNGEKRFRVSYNPDPNNYNTVTNIEVTVNVGCSQHVFGEWKESKAPSCMETGLEKRTCGKCGYQESRSTLALGHNYTSKVTKEPTETAEGVRTYTCSRCNDTYTETIAKLPPHHTHSYTSKVTTEPGCTSTGLKTYSCSCGDTYTETIAAYGHNMVDGKCTRCGYKEPDKPVDTPAPPQNNGSGGDSGSDHHSGGSSGGNPPAANSQSGSSGGQQSGGGGTAPAPEQNGRSGTNTQPGTNTQDAQGSQTQAAQGGDNPKQETQGAGSTPEKSPYASTPDNSKKEDKPVVNMEMKETTVLSEGALEIVKEKGADVVLDMGNGVSWNIRGGEVKDEDLKDIDMGVEISEMDVPEEAAALTEGRKCLQITLAHNGEYGFLPVLSLNVGEDSKGQFANLFYNNEETGELEFVCASPVDEAGNVSFEFVHASEYAVIVSDTSMEGLAPTAGVEESQSSADTDASAAADAAAQDAAAEEADEFIAGLSQKTVLLILLGVLGVAAVGIGVALAVRERKDRE